MASRGQTPGASNSICSAGGFQLRLKTLLIGLPGCKYSRSSIKDVCSRARVGGVYIESKRMY